MKAVRLHAYGDASVLNFEDAPMPEVGAEDVLIKVVATSINPVDWKIREGYLKSMIDYPMPLTLGLDVSGVVTAVGPDAKGFKIGDAVYSRPDVLRNGSYAEYVVVRANEVAMKPRTISHVEAATLPLVSITAWEALFTTADLQPGQKVLIHAGSGGVGSIAVQLAKWKGAEVTATTSAPNMEFVRGLGADQVIDYRAGPITTGGFDVVFDTIGGDTQEASWGLLKPGGILVSITQKPSEERAASLGVRSAYLFISPNAAILAKLADLVDASVVRPVIGAEFALKDMAAAHTFSETGRTRGKIAIYVGQP
jgi:NADPH:quinone reductase-like Zn-dependent oxidoreductase